MLAERITCLSVDPAELTPFPTHCSELFVAAKTPLESIKSTLFQQNTRGGVSRRNLRSARTGHLPKFTVLPCAPYRFLCSLFSWPYKPLFAQPPFLSHLYKTPGVAESTGRLSDSSGRGNSIAQPEMRNLQGGTRATYSQPLIDSTRRSD